MASLSPEEQTQGSMALLGAGAVLLVAGLWLLLIKAALRRCRGKRRARKQVQARRMPNSDDDSFDSLDDESDNESDDGSLVSVSDQLVIGRKPVQAGDEEAAASPVAPPSPAEKEDLNPFDDADNPFDAPLKAVGAARKASKQKTRKALEGNGKPSAAERSRALDEEAGEDLGPLPPPKAWMPDAEVQKAQEIARAYNTQRFKPGRSLAL